MADKTFKDISSVHDELIRKGLTGGVFIADPSAAAVTAITADSTGAPGTPTLKALPTGYKDLGRIDDAGAVFASAVSTSDITSWGSVEPTRRDITADVGTVHMVLQETSKQTLALYYGVDPADIVPDTTTGEIVIPKPVRPVTRYHRILAVAVDDADGGEIYIARFWPRANLSDRGDQGLSSSDAGILWDVTMTAFTDSALGYSESTFVGGPGWKPLLTAAGF